MDWLIRLLQENFILVILLGGWLLSIFGNVLTKAARKAAEQQRRQAQSQRPQPPQAGPRRAAQARPTAPAPRRPAQPTADEIAAEIRRVMGLEEPPPRAPEPPPPPPVEEPAGPREAGFEHFAEGLGGLRSTLGKRHVPTSRSAARQVLGSLGGRFHKPRVVAATRRQRRFNLNDPAAAIVTMEILGKPRALRDFEF